MKWTAYQRRQLDALTYLRGNPPSVWRVLTFRPLAWLPFLFIAALSFAYYLLNERWGMFMLGMTAGAFLRIISYARFTVMAWPVTEAVTDWLKVAALRKETSV